MTDEKSLTEAVQAAARPSVEVKGYTPLTDAQKELANEGKILEERCMRWLDKVYSVIGPSAESATSIDHPIAFVQVGRRSIQQGFMWAVRSIFQPSRIALPEDEAKE